jgi:hypothetical protein
MRGATEHHVMARTQYDTLQDMSSPPAGHYADMESRVEQIAAMINEHALALDAIITPQPGGIGAADGLIAAAVVDGDVNGAIAVEYTFQIADAATATYDVVVAAKCEIVDVEVIKTAANGGAANTVQVKNAGAAVSDAISININQDAIARAAVRTQANAIVNAAAQLQVTVTKAGGNAACFVVVKCIKR